MSNATLLAVDPPQITEHPKSQSVPIGGEAAFKVEVKEDNLTFQWQKNGSNLQNDGNCSGTDTKILSIRHVRKSDVGSYKCLVKNGVLKDGIVSKEAQLGVSKFKFICCVDAVTKLFMIVKKAFTWCIMFF